MYEGMGLSVTMAVLSQGNEKIKLIDARGMFDAGRRTNTFSEKHIEEIKRLVKSEESQERCKIVTLADVERNNFSLDINRYIDSARTYKNSVSLGEIAENISRGAGCRAAELDAITSQTATPYQYLMLGDIVDGFISDDLPYITEIPKGNNRYTLKKGDIIISKMASPTKVAIVEEDYRTILASGNLYIIRLKNDTINPYFLKAYLESADGIAAISRICVGTAVPAIPVSELKQLQIPLLDKEKENEIVQKYMIAADEIKMLKRRLEKVKSSISSLFEEVE